MEILTELQNKAPEHADKYQEITEKLKKAQRLRKLK